MAEPNFDMPRHAATMTIDISGQNVAQVVEEFGRFAAASEYVVGVVLSGNADVDASAFTGGHRTDFSENHSTVTVNLNTDDGIRHATRLLISDERLAEIADAYVLPEHLKHPENHVDAFIGHIIKGLVGYSDDTQSSFSAQAIQSNLNIIFNAAENAAQLKNFALGGEVNLSNAQYNTLFRAQQVETMEHVLRFLIARNQALPYMRGELYAGIDYHWGDGILGEALAVVNGSNGFNQANDPESNDLLYKGTLESKTSIAYKEGTVFVSDYRGPVPIWPASAVEAYSAEQLAKKEALDLDRQTAMEASAAIGAAERLVREENVRQAFLAVQAQMDEMSAAGFEWIGVNELTSGGGMDSVEVIRDFYCEKYGYDPADVRIISGAAIYAGRTINLSGKSVTVYVRGGIRSAQ